MAKSRKVIITCAVTGSIHTPSMSPHIPVTAQQIADAAIGAAEAGAAIVHLHARNPQDGRPDQSPEAFAPFLKVIKQRSNVVVNITTGGAPTMMVEERVRPAATFKPEVASLNMGTMNFGLYPICLLYTSVEGLNKLPGVSCATPKGAFYAFPNIKRTGWKAKALASSLLDDAGVAIIGGPDFGILGEGYVRLLSLIHI